MSQLEVYTDGACDRSGRGAWSWVAIRRYDTDSPHDCGAPGDMVVLAGEAGAEAGTTNQRMEMTAFARALEYALGAAEPVLVVSDSAYVTNCVLDGWWRRWLRNGWTSSKGLPVENRDLWEWILGLLGVYAELLATPGGRAEPRRFTSSPVQVRHVRGHGRGDDPTHDPYRAGNHVADRMADDALERARERDAEAGVQ